MNLSIIIPVLNEADIIEESLQRLQRHCDSNMEIIIVDGGSDDATQALIASMDLENLTLINSASGRALQMNTGAASARGDLLLFLHIDTVLPDNFFRVLSSLESPCWGRFDVQFHEQKLIFNIIAASMNLRSRLTGIATGDQAIFISRTMFDDIGGYEPIQLMEDVSISGKLKRQMKPCCLAERVVISSRRWRKGGIYKTILLMWCLRFAYFIGVNPSSLSNYYD